MKVLSVIAILLFAIQSPQSRNIEHFFITMPNIVNPILTQQQRFELLEFFKADMGDSITNRFGTQTRILVLDTLNNHILVQNTDISTFEMLTVISETDTIISIIRTVCAPICQSNIEFFDTRWEKRSDITFTFPEAVDWINAEKLENSSLSFANVRNALNTSFISLSFFIPSPYHKSQIYEINATNNSLEFLDEKERKLLAPLMNDGVLIYGYLYPSNSGQWMKMRRLVLRQ